jgi:GTPase SAR1 family protein
MNQCYICKETKKTLKHHLSYLPQVIINVCNGCHNKIHRGELLEYKPTDRRMQLIFYSKKGYLEFTKKILRIPFKHYEKSKKGFIWTKFRPLTEKEKFLRKEMKKNKVVIE